MLTDRGFNGSNLEKNSEADESARTEINIVITKPSSSGPMSTAVSFFKYESTITMTSFIDQIKENKDKGLYNGISCSYNETDDTFISDLVRFIKY